LRAIKPWLHHDFAYKSTKYHKIDQENEKTLSWKFIPEILENVRNNQTFHKFQKPKSFVGALMDKKYELREKEIFDEIKTVLLAVSVIIDFISNF
jgi:hypothetical protein